ncbi:hypothetical protein C8F01DRAFT_1054782 [Mycena amicta]|nr:hypothetical protein C8F01DRAFT_1054782 [Mycena amicta]
MADDTLVSPSGLDTSQKTAPSLSLAETFTFIRLLVCLKNDIVLVQPSRVHDERAPLVLPPSIICFISDVLKIDEQWVEGFWAELKDEVWGWPDVVPTKEEEEMFRQHGWKRGLTSLVLYPPSHYCDNPSCGRQSPLKKATSRQVVVYTLGRGVLPAYEIKLYCPDCLTAYFPDFSVFQGLREYYSLDQIAEYIQIGAHQFAEKRLIVLWITMMLVAWVSGTNCSRIYELAMSQGNEELFESGGWQFGCILTTNHIWDAFTLYTLLDYHLRKGSRLKLPHTGLQKDRMTAAMETRNVEVVRYGFEETLGHGCDLCTRKWINKDGVEEEVQVVVTDGLAIGHVRCQKAHCITPLASNRDRFCPTHANMADECAVVGCTKPVRAGHKTCEDAEHIKMETLHFERGSAAFTLRERLHRHRKAHPGDIHNTDDEDDGELHDGEPLPDLHEDDEWFESRPGDGEIMLRRQADPGTVGVLETVSPTGELVACESQKSSSGNRKHRALFGRSHTHNEQTLVLPCSLFTNRATFYNAEAVSNVLDFVQKACSVPGARKPHHLIYDTNCDAAQQVGANEDWSWFDDIGMFVDVFHFKNKHGIQHDFCQEHCNPADCAQLMTDEKTWYFNTSVAEQTNVWLGGYLAIVREMLPVKYNFFLNEMIRLHNHLTLAKLEGGDHNIRTLPARGPLPIYQRRRV